LESFNSASSCENAINKLVKRRGEESDKALAADPEKDKCGNSTPAAYKADNALTLSIAAGSAKCIATDDPRLHR
jgi:hypothetical protein